MLNILVATVVSIFAFSAQAGTKIVCKQNASVFDITIESESNLHEFFSNAQEYTVQVTHGYMTRGHWQTLATDKITAINTRAIGGMMHFIKLENEKAFIELEEITYNAIGAAYFVGFYNNGVSESQLVCERLEN